MRLLCPNCAKELQVPDQYAGQMMKCPLCNGTFTVPSLPAMPGAVSMPPPAPPPPPSSPIMAPPPPSPMMAPPPSYSPVEQAAGAGQTLTISPRLVNWLAPVCLLGMLAMLFFNWVGMFPGEVPVLTQTGVQVALGDASANTAWESYSAKEKYWEPYYGSDVTPLKAPGWSPLILFFILLLIPATLLALAASAISSGILKIQPPPALATIWPMRFLILAGLTGGCLVLLVLNLWFDFPLENRANDMVKAEVVAKQNQAATAEKADQQRWAIEEGVRLGGFALRTTHWLSMVVILNLLAVLGALMQFRMDRKGAEGLPSIQLRR